MGFRQRKFLHSWLLSAFASLTLGLVGCAGNASPAPTAGAPQAATPQATQIVDATATTESTQTVAPTVAPTAQIAEPTATEEPATDDIAMETPTPVDPSKPTATEEPEPTAKATATPLPTPTSTALPSKATVENDLPKLLGAGVNISTDVGQTEADKGRIQILIRGGTSEPIPGAYIRIFTQKKDLADQPVINQEVANGRTNEDGEATFDVLAGTYIVASDMVGYNWGSAHDVNGQADVLVETGKVTKIDLGLGLLEVGLLRADNSAVRQQYVRVFTQKKDIAGNWVVGNEVANGRTENSGGVRFALTTGYYIVQVDIAGHNWGDAKGVNGRANVALEAGKQTSVIPSLGRIVVGPLSTSGVLANQFVQIHTQKPDASGKPALDVEVVNGRTSNLGFIAFDLTPGTYAVTIEGATLFDVPSEGGKVTFSDGIDFDVKAADEPLSDKMVNDLPQIEETGTQITYADEKTESDKGRIVIAVQNGRGEPVAQAYFRVYSQLLDLTGKAVAGQEIVNRRTDKDGGLGFDLPKGKYIVAADFAGYAWGNSHEPNGVTDVEVDAERVAQMTLSLGALKVGVLRADKTVVTNQFVRVWWQQQDLVGRWTQMGEMVTGRTDNTGAVSFDLASGYYAVETDLPGYNWGDARGMEGQMSVALKPGQETPIIIRLGRLQVALLNAGGQPDVDKFVQVFTQKKDETGAQVADQEVENGRADNTGVINFDLTHGNYTLKIDERFVYDITIEPGKVTLTDGTQWRVQTE